MVGKNIRVWAMGLAMVALAAGTLTPAAQATGLNLTGRYDTPASFALKATDFSGNTIRAFGFGVLLCDTGSSGGGLDLSDDTGLQNGACWQVPGGHDHHPFVVTAADSASSEPPISVVFDYLGNGCQSQSCGLPANVAFSGCGSVSGAVPSGRAGTEVWVFARAFDVDPLAGRLCFGTSGSLFGSF